MVGTDYQTVKNEMETLLDNQEEYDAMANAKNPYGDGRAAQRIVEAIQYHFGQLKERPKEFK